MSRVREHGRRAHEVQHRHTFFFSFFNLIVDISQTKITGKGFSFFNHMQWHIYSLASNGILLLSFSILMTLNFQLSSIVERSSPGLGGEEARAPARLLCAR